MILNIKTQKKLKSIFRQMTTGLVLLFIFGQTVFSQTVTTGSLVEEMVNLEQLGEYPEPFFRTIQFSSYDRRSDQPDGPGWYANSDGFGKEPIPNFEGVLEEPGEDGIGTYLICDVEGPGAIVRGWTATMGGELRVYLDKSETPLYEGPARPFLENTYLSFLENTGLESEIFENTFHQRDAGYFPIPYAEHLRVEWTGNLDELHFYYLQVRVYDKVTQVKTFQPEDLKTYKKEIEHTAYILSNPDEHYSTSGPVETIENISAELKSGEMKEVLSLEGESAIRYLELELNAEDIEKALRQTILNIKFDNVLHAQVQAPLGDYFGAAPGINPYVSLPFTVQSDGKMISRFLMPFKESAKIELDNKGDQNVQIRGTLKHIGYNWDTNRSMHFRARWRVDHNMDEKTPYDLPFVLARGQGVYVGTSSLLFNPIEIPTAGGNWWGEGDEKIFVDDDTFPSTFGTGSEDYYNYSWSSPDIFQTPYSGQPRNDGPANRGFITNHRWHILDALPFQRDIQFYMEFFPHSRKKGFSYARMSYFYSRPGLKDDHIPISYDDIQHIEHNRWTPEAKGGAINSVFYQVEEIVDDKRMELIENNLWAEGKLLVWNPEKQGDELELPFKVKEDGDYKIWITAAKMDGAGKMSVRVNGQKVGFGGPGETINLQVPDRILLRNYSSRNISLEKGNHTVSIRFEGSEQVGRNRIGLDFLWVQKR